MMLKSRLDFMEFRHEEWFSESSDKKALFEILAQNKIGSVITDCSGRRDGLHMELTTPEVMIRFVGNGGDFIASDRKRIEDWIERLKIWLDKAWKRYTSSHTVMMGLFLIT